MRDVAWARLPSAQRAGGGMPAAGPVPGPTLRMVRCQAPPPRHRRRPDKPAARPGQHRRRGRRRRELCHPRTPVSAETPAAVAACKGLPAWNGLPPHQGRRPGPAAPSGTGSEPADATAARKAGPGNQPIRGLRDLVDHLAILTRETMPIAGRAIDKLTIATPASSAPSTSPAPRSRSACPPGRRRKTTRNHNPRSSAGSATSADVPSA